MADMVYFSMSTAFDARTAARWFREGAFCAVSSAEDMKAAVPHLEALTDEDVWKGYLNNHAGYALASEAIRLVYQKYRYLGVQYVLQEEDGQIMELIQDVATPGSMIGVRSIRGHEHSHAANVHSVTILAVGAHIGKLLPEMRPQITAKASSVAHLQLTKSEALAPQNTPVINLSELEFWMEPLRVFTDEMSKQGRVAVPTENDPDDSIYLLKLCCHGGGWTYMQDKEGVKQYSIPPEEKPRNIPEEDEAQLREVVERLLPSLFHTRPFVCESICWCADTASSNYVVDHVPGCTNVILAGTDSGHAFKMLPIAERLGVEVLAGRRASIGCWKWKAVPEQAKHEVLSVNWRVGAVKDIGSVQMIETRIPDVIVT